MLTLRTSRALADARPGLHGCALVPTMGALHDGHLALVRAARSRGPVIASIFVNPLQFGPDEDLDRYPRDEPGDLAMLSAAGCTAVFLPDLADIYPPGSATTVEVAGPALGWEGARRPGHFRGVATVVARLLGLVAPSTAWFGEKDWQQVQVVRRMVSDLAVPVAVHAVPIQRAPDGLALSSRNRFLSPAERAIAPALARTCTQIAACLHDGAPVPATLAEGVETLEARGFAVDYLAAVDPDTLAPLDPIDRPARLIAAAQLGSVRLLDNMAI